MPRDFNVTYREGPLTAAYLRFQAVAPGGVARTQPDPDGMLVDFNAQGRPVGIEFIAPSKITVSGINTLLTKLNQPPAAGNEIER